MRKLEFKPQDRQSIDFAERERRKSKNLWNSALRKGCYVFSNGTYDHTNTDYACNENLIEVEPNSTITISFKGLPKSIAGGFIFFNNGVYVGCEGNGATTAKVPSNANQVGFDFWYADIGNNLNLIYDIQLEYASTESEFEESAGGDIVRGNRNIVRRETIYDMDSTFERKTIINGVSYTNGIKLTHDNVVEIPIDTTKVQKVIVWIEACPHSGNWFSDGTSPLIMDLRQPNITSDAQFRANLLIAPNIQNKTSDFSNHFYGFTARMSSWDSSGLGVRHLTILPYRYNYSTTGEIIEEIRDSNGNTCDNIRITKVEVELC